MIGWLLKKVATSTAHKPVATVRKTSPDKCALWHDVSRALDAKPRTAK